MLTRRNLLARTGMVLAGTAAARTLGACAATRRPPEGAPNLLLVIADDMRWDCLGAAGNEVIRTPHLDALAGEGARFSNHFVTTAICACSRASILTGEYVRRHGIRGFETPLGAGEMARSYAGVLRRMGYRTGFVGKWGIGGPLPQDDYDFFRGYGERASYWHEQAGRRVHDTPNCVAHARDFLRGGRDGRPFCLSVSFKAPHGPHGEFEPQYADLYRDAAFVKPPSPAGDASLPPFLAESPGGSKESRETPEQYAEIVRGYYRLITGLDAAVGEIRAMLHELGEDERTVIVFTSDNGLFLGEHGLLGKWLMYEESIRVPLIVRDPSLPSASRGRRDDRMTLNIDIAPTLLDAAGAGVPAAMQGRSVRTLVANAADPGRADWFYEYHRTPEVGDLPSSEGVRSERYAYVRYVDVVPPYEQLFDLAEDPGEANNLAGRAEATGVLESMRARWKELREAAR